MAPVITHALLGASVAALSAVAVRAASPIAPRGLTRMLVAAPIAASAAVAEAILLGLLALGGSTIALTITAIGTWALARALLPRPTTSPAAELSAWWHERTRAERTLLAAMAGAAGAWIVWQL